MYTKKPAKAGFFVPADPGSLAGAFPFSRAKRASVNLVADRAEGQGGLSVHFSPKSAPPGRL